VPADYRLANILDGMTTIHTGGRYASFVRLPVIPTP